jgi:SpoVK/Ycf46/Vps4 family AAA+-type ATPase
MQEKTSPVFVVATANNIDRLPPEFLRKGRFDEIFFVDLPTKSERQIIWKIQIEKRVTKPEIQGSLVLDSSLYSRLADLSTDFSGAEIEQAVIAGLFDAFTEKRPINERDFVRALDATVPLSKTQAEQIKLIRDWANARAISATSSADLAFELHEYEEHNKIQDNPEEPPRGGRTIDV